MPDIRRMQTDSDAQPLPYAVFGDECRVAYPGYNDNEWFSCVAPKPDVHDRETFRPIANLLGLVPLAQEPFLIDFDLNEFELVNVSPEFFEALNARDDDGDNRYRPGYDPCLLNNGFRSIHEEANVRLRYILKDLTGHDITPREVDLLLRSIKNMV